MTDARYRPEIDGLRAIAVAAVVLYHAGADLLPGGFVGVDVFFVISGYLITSILALEWRRTGRIDLIAFYARRMRRLLPALLTVLLATVLVAALLLPGLGRFQDFAASAMASVLFVANVYFDIHTGGYFDPGTDRQPLLHLWSLAVEEQFYLLYPLLLLWLLRLARARQLAVLGALSVGSLLLAEYWLGVSPGNAFYQMPARFWELALGGMVALAPARTLSPGRAALHAGAGLGLVVLTTVLMPPGARFPGLGALSAVLGAGLVLRAVHGSAEQGLPGRLLSLRPLVLLGLVSYPLYLWHWPILVLDQATRLAPAGVGWRLMLCALATLLAWLTWRFIEAPFRGAWGGRPATVVRSGLLASLAMLMGVLWLTSLNPGAEDAARVARTRADRPADMAQCHFDTSSRITALAPAACRSRPGVEARVAIWGDSHALAWKPLAWALAADAGLSAEAHTMDACPPITGYRGRQATAPRFGEQCAAFNALVMQRIGGGQYELLVIAARWPAHLGVPLSSVAEAERASVAQRQVPTPEALLAGLEESIDLASKHARRVLVIGPIPAMPYDVPDCLAAVGSAECVLARREFERLVAPVQRALLAAAVGRPNVEVLDPTGFFCPSSECPAVKDGYGLFWDDDHVSSTAARAFAVQYLADPGRFRLTAPAATGGTTQ